MKGVVVMKLFRCLLLLFSLLLSMTLLACGTDKSENPDPPFLSESGIETADPVPEHYTDMDEFIATLTTAEAAKAQPGAIGITLEMTQVPTLHSPDFQFRMVENLKHYFIYTYIPITGDVTSNLIKHDEVFMIYASKYAQSEPSEELLQKWDGEYIDYAYEAERNTWRINYNGKRVWITFPDDIVLTSPEQIADYFTFETYYYTVPADSGAVTE
jgi:hypothetical protein